MKITRRMLRQVIREELNSSRGALTTQWKKLDRDARELSHLEAISTGEQRDMYLTPDEATVMLDRELKKRGYDSMDELEAALLFTQQELDATHG